MTFTRVAKGPGGRDESGTRTDVEPEEKLPPSHREAVRGGTVTPEGSHTSQIPSFTPDWTLRILGRIEKLIPKRFRPEEGFLLSLKNRILISTMILLVGVVTLIGIALQVMVFPKLRGYAEIIVNLKIIHFLSSIAVIAISWLFIEFISKRITSPLRDLTKTADQISREAGESLASSPVTEGGLPEVEALEVAGRGVAGDEILTLTSSFNRMLVYLKASEARLRDSEEKYRFLFDSGPSPIFVIDAEDMRILDVNAKAVEEYQYTREQFLSMSFADLGFDRDREQTSNLLRQIFPTEVALLPVVQHRRKDGSLLMVNFQAGLSRYRNRPAVIAAVWDVTERLEKHAMLIQAGKMATLGEMATGIAHELNQPLNVVRLGCDYLGKKMRSGQSITPEELGKITKELTDSVERASKIINHLRQFGRKAEESMSPIDVNTPILNVFTLVGTQLETRGIRWRLSLGENLPKILGDDNRLEQVFINLVLNARDAILARERNEKETAESWEKLILINSFLANERIVVTVSDTGIGIPEATGPRVFEPFFTTKKSAEGTGLGLSITYGIIKEHNGTIEIDREITDGAAFRLTFPPLKDGDA